MNLKIVTDSTCDLPETLLVQYDITVIPLYINIGKRSYLDGVELSAEEFYTDLPSYTPFPTTAAPGVETFTHVYEKLMAQGATGILSIHVSSLLSATFNHAYLAGQEIKDTQVLVFDSGQMSMGLGFLAITAAKAASMGQNIKEIANLLEAQVKRTYLLGILDTLEFLRRSGRANLVMTSLGSLLQIKPVLKLYYGQITSERVRTRKRAIKRFVLMLNALAPFEDVAMLHSHAIDRAEALQQQVSHLLPSTDIPLVEITPILGSHLGPGGVGIVCITKH